MFEFQQLEILAHDRDGGDEAALTGFLAVSMDFH